jgi:hypothetical protein
MSKIKILAASAMLMTAVVMVSCGGTGDDSARRESRDLYKESVQLLKLYTDSFRVAHDSVAVERISAGLEDALTRLNFRVSPEADPGITEGENDTLTRMNERFVYLRDSLLYAFAHDQHLATDTVEAETEPVGTGGN